MASKTNQSRVVETLDDLNESLRRFLSSSNLTGVPYFILTTFVYITISWIALVLFTCLACILTTTISLLAAIVAAIAILTFGAIWGAALGCLAILSSGVVGLVFLGGVGLQLLAGGLFVKFVGKILSKWKARGKRDLVGSTNNGGGRNNVKFETS